MNEEENIPSGAKQILNAHRGITNIVEHETISDDLQKTAEYLFNVLAKHYGPLCGYAALDENKFLSETVFTKDGIGIIRAIEYVSPQENWVRKMIAFIGSKIESSVGDGTTSAMLFTCAMIKHMAENLKEIQPVATVTMQKAFDRVIQMIRTGLNSLAVRPLDYRDSDPRLYKTLIEKVAMQQCYTSTHGDVELSKALTEVFVNTPPELWDKMMWERRRQESDERFSVDSDDGQYTMRAEVWAKSMLNKDFASWYEADNATLIVIHDSPRCTSPDWDGIARSIQDSTEENPVVIVCHKQWDNDTYDKMLALINETQRDKKSVAIFVQDPENPRINDFVSLQLLANQNILQFRKGEAMFLNGIHVKFINDRLSFDGLYETPAEYKAKGRLERYHMHNTANPQFSDYVEGVKKMADGLSKLTLTDQIRRQQTEYYRMYAKLYYEKSARFIIGGNTHDNLALVDVVDDAIRATARALKNGVVLGNNKSLYAVVNSLWQTDASSDDIINWFFERIIDSLEDIADVAIKSIAPDKKFSDAELAGFRDWWFSSNVDLITFPAEEYTIGGGSTLLGDGEFTLPTTRHFTWDEEGAEYSSCLRELLTTNDRNTQLIVQPANTDIDMLTRFAEFAIKFILTERIIVKNGAYVEDKFNFGEFIQGILGKFFSKRGKK